MAAEKALALVVRGTDWSETSRISTLFTREFGKVRALAKGGRRLKSNFDVAFDLLSVCNIVFLRKSSGGLDLLTEAQMVERFPALRKDLAALYAGYYVAELLSDGTQDYDPHPPLFDAALATLRSLGEVPNPPAPFPPREGGAGSEPNPPAPFPKREGGADLSPLSAAGRGLGEGSRVSLAVIRFELVWLHELGYSPRLDVCAGCQTVIVPGVVRVAYSPSAGGVLCSACAQGFADRRPLSDPALLALRELTAGDEAGPELPPAVRGELRQLLGQVVSYVLGRRPRLLGYIEAADRRG